MYMSVELEKMMTALDADMETLLDATQGFDTVHYYKVDYVPDIPVGDILVVRVVDEMAVYIAKCGDRAIEVFLLTERTPLDTDNTFGKFWNKLKSEGKKSNVEKVGKERFN